MIQKDSQAKTPIQKVAEILSEIGHLEHAVLGSELFQDIIPGRWIEDPTFRCPNEHVSKMILRCDDDGPRDRCLGCHEPTTMTFPEDRDGPLDKAVAMRDITKAAIERAE